jgi:enoyl-CoA hydratase/carnithine racemase
MTNKYSMFLVEKEDNIAVMKFNRPDKFNAASVQLFHEMAACVRELDSDEKVGCIILTGQTYETKKGPRPFFSAGADVESFARLGKTEAGFEFIKVCFEPFRAIEEVATPVIAAVNGAAFGFGFEIALTCDMIYAGKSARFALKEINHGAIPAFTITRGLEKLSKQLIAYLCMTANEISAQHAKDIGVVLDVFEDDALLPNTIEVAKKIASHSPMALAYIKSILNRKSSEQYGDAERFMPSIFATQFMQGAFDKFLKGETRNKS